MALVAQSFPRLLAPVGAASARPARTLSRALLGLALGVGVLLGPPLASVASAQEHEPPSEAMTYFEQAREAYREGRYPDAAADLERALVLDPNAPTLLFNLGRVYELMGRYDDAIDVYTRLQAITPVTEQEERARTEQILERLRGAREHAAPPPSVETVGAIEQGPTFVRERGVADVPFWVTLASGGAITLVAAILGGVALGAHGDLGGRVLSADYPYTRYQDDLNSAQVLGGVADVLGAVGGATMVGALLLFGLRERVYEMWPSDGDPTASRARGPSARLVVGAGTLGLEGSF